jgi:hypothetical protein
VSYLRVIIVIVPLFFLVIAGSADAGIADRAKQKAAKYWKPKIKPKNFCEASAVRVKHSKNLGGVWGLAPLYGCRGYNLYGKTPVIKILKTVKQSGWVWYCSLVIHEYGHVVGRDHSKNPKNIMHSTISTKNLKRRACR